MSDRGAGGRNFGGWKLRQLGRTCEPAKRRPGAPAARRDAECHISGSCEANDGPEFGISQGPISKERVAVNPLARRDGFASVGGIEGVWRSAMEMTEEWHSDEPVGVDRRHDKAVGCAGWKRDDGISGIDWLSHGTPGLEANLTLAWIYFIFSIACFAYCFT